jgi:transposase
MNSLAAMRTVVSLGSGGAVLSVPFLLTPAQMGRIRPHNPRRTRRARHHRLHPAEAEPQAIPAGKALYRQRHRIAVAFARLEDCRRIATRDDRCATAVFGAITLAAIVIVWLGE